MRKLLLATHNPAKVRELKIGLKPLEEAGIKLVSLADLGIEQEPEETGMTFEKNAFLKAKFYANLAHLPIVADDGGIAIESLNGEPGVKSRMWMGREASDEELINYTLERLQGYPKAKRRAYFETCVLFYEPKTQASFFKKERLYGYITDKTSSKRIKGYPFRSLFIVSDLNNKYYDELTQAEHSKINHRLKAVKRLVQKIKIHLLK